jgi:hypothetical protein
VAEAMLDAIGLVAPSATVAERWQPPPRVNVHGLRLTPV